MQIDCCKMKLENYFMKKLLWFLLILMLIPSVVSAEGEITSIDQLNQPDVTIATVTGSLYDAIVRERFPNAQLALFDNLADILTAVKTGKVDAIAWDDSTVRYLISQGEPLSFMGDYLMEIENAAIFQKNEAGEALEKQYSEFLKELWADGTMAEIDAKWFASDDSLKTMIDYEALPDTNGTLTMAVDPTMAPFDYVKDNRVVGYEVELAARFCEANGYRLKVQTMSFGSLIPAVLSGKMDFASSCITITDERAESVRFSEPLYRGGGALAILSDGSAAAPQESIVRSLLDGKRIGIQTGTSYTPMVEENLPNSEISYYNSYSDLVTALTGNKIDGFPIDEPVARYISNENPAVGYLPEYLDPFDFAFVFRKDEQGAKLRDEVSEFLAQIKNDGTFEEIGEIWFGTDPSKQVLPDYASFPAPNGVLHLATEALNPPFTYVENGAIVGFEIDIAARFCEVWGYGLDIDDMSFDAILPSVQSGKYDFGCATISITEERKESVHFSEPDYSGGVVFVVRTEDLPAAVPSGNFENVPAGVYNSLAELSGKTLGVQTGQSFDQNIKETIPNAAITYLNSKADLVSALITKKIEGFATDEPVAKTLIRSNEELTYIPEYMNTFEFGYVFPKNESGAKLRDQFSEFLRQIKSDGTLSEIDARWFSEDETGKTIPDYKNFPAPNGVLHMATEALYEPFTYISDNEIIGYDIDIAARFCEAYGYGLEIEDMSFSAVLPSVVSGKCDFGGAGITITPERAESVHFSEPNYSGGTVIVVRREKNEKTDAVALLDGKRIGIQTGTSYTQMVEEKLPNAHISYYNSYTDLLTALAGDKIDAFTTDEPVIRFIMNEDPAVSYIPEIMDPFDFAYVIAKTSHGEKLREQFNEFLVSIKQDGTIQEIEDVWFGTDESKKTLPDYASFPAPNGKLHMATQSVNPPFAYVENGQVTGYEIDIAVRFCEAYRYGLVVDDMNFESILPAVQSGKCDFGGGTIAITEERAESVLFSEPNYSGGVVFAVRASNSDSSGNNVGQSGTGNSTTDQRSSFFDSIKSSFEKTFIRENRWKLIVEGIRNTLIITLLAVIFGTILGFLLFMLCRNGNPIINLLTDKVLWLVQGMPGVVLLMILFYVVFGSVAIDGILVAVIGFSLTFGASVFGLLKMGVGAVDNGQYEASYALGYSNIRTFFRIILPQAIPHVISAYKGEIVSLLKGTAIVGYIAVQDLTKMGDIIRSRTYEAFFPLIAVTIIYFLLEMLLGAFIRTFQIQIDPKKRKAKDILKGVKTND